MAFLGVLSLFAALLAIFIVLICLIGIGLIIIGCTGLAMNKIYIKQMQVETNSASSFYNILSIILGVLFLLFPLGCTLGGIFSTLIN